MNSNRSFMPSAATLANLAAGVLAIVLAVSGRPDFGALMVLAAMLFDSVDGALARAFDACSDFGAELDSLADMVSFGVAPGLLVVAGVPASLNVLGAVAAVGMALCAALRLARYNVERGEKSAEDGFTGMPTTAAGGCVAATVLMQGVLAGHGLEISVVFLPWLALIFAVLMVSNLTYPHIGVLFSKLPTPLAISAAATLALAALWWVHEVVFFVCFLTYAVSGPVLTVHEKVKAHRHANIG